VKRSLARARYVLSRVAGANLHIRDVETKTMVDLLQRSEHPPDAQALVVVEIAKSQNRLLGRTEDFLVIREFGPTPGDHVGPTSEGTQRVVRATSNAIRVAVEAADATVDHADIRASALPPRDPSPVAGTNLFHVQDDEVTTAVG
jgi:hypothetical protein